MRISVSGREMRTYSSSSKALSVSKRPRGKGSVQNLMRGQRVLGKFAPAIHFIQDPSLTNCSNSNNVSIAKAAHI